MELERITVKPGFWSELFTAPRIISFLVMLSGGAMWVQATRSEISQLRREVESFKSDYQRSDTLRLELQAIRDEQRALREGQQRTNEQQTRIVEQMIGLRRDLR